MKEVAKQKALTIDELKQMAGEPVWIPEIESYAIVKVDKVGGWANTVFARGTSYLYNGRPFDVGADFEYNVEKRELDCYRVN